MLSREDERFVMADESEKDITFYREKAEKAEKEMLTVAALARHVLENDNEKNKLIDSLRQQVSQKSSEVERANALLKSHNSLMAEYEEDVANLNRKLENAAAEKSACSQDWERKVNTLHHQLAEKDSDLSKAKEEICQLRSDLGEKNRQIEAALRAPVNEGASASNNESFTEAEFVRLSNRINSLDEEREELLEQFLSMQKAFINLTRELETERGRVEELNALCSGYKRDAEERRNRIMELTEELDEYRRNDGKMAKRGNSMFAEFVDERLKLEKDLLKLASENNWLLARNEELKRENENQRQELLLALSLRTADSVGGDNTTELRQEIDRLRSQIAVLSSRVAVTQYGPINDANKESSSQAENRYDRFKNTALSHMRNEIEALRQKCYKAENERNSFFDKLRDAENRCAKEARKVRDLEVEVKCLEGRLRLEVARNQPKKMTKEARETLKEKIADAREYMSVGDSLLTLTETSSATLTTNTLETPPSGRLSAAREEDITVVEENDIVNDALSRRMTPECGSRRGTASMPASLLKTKQTNEGGGLPLQKRIKRVKFAEEESWLDNDSHVDSMTSAEGHPLSSARSLPPRRSRRRKLTNVREACVADENKPECSQQ